MLKPSNPRQAMMMAAQKEGRVVEVPIENAPLPPRFKLPKGSVIVNKLNPKTPPRVALPQVCALPKTPVRSSGEGPSAAPRRSALALQMVDGNQLPQLSTAREISARTIFAPPTPQVERSEEIALVFESDESGNDDNDEDSFADLVNEIVESAPVQLPGLMLDARVTRPDAPPPSDQSDLPRPSFDEDIDITLRPDGITSSSSDRDDGGGDIVRLHEGALLPRVKTWLDELRSDSFRQKLATELTPTTRFKLGDILNAPVVRCADNSASTESAASTFTGSDSVTFASPVVCARRKLDFSPAQVVSPAFLRLVKGPVRFALDLEAPLLDWTAIRAFEHREAESRSTLEAQATQRFVRVKDVFSETLRRLQKRSIKPSAPKEDDFRGFVEPAFELPQLAPLAWRRAALYTTED